MEEMLKGLLPRIFPNEIRMRYIKFQGKQDLEKGLQRKLRGYLAPGARFIVLRDQDSGDCISIKQHLKHLCNQAGKPDTVIRIVCRELESWFLGDLAAVEAGLALKGLAQRQNEQKFRSPDKHNNAKQILERLTDGKYRQISSSRAIGPHLNPERNKSRSFHVFIEGVKKLTEAA